MLWHTGAPDGLKPRSSAHQRTSSRGRQADMGRGMPRSECGSTNKTIASPENLVASRRSWELRAACRGRISVSFFPSVGESPSQRSDRELVAKRICSRCPVRQECLEYALLVPEPFGIWGGLNEDDRRVLSAERAHPERTVR